MAEFGAREGRRAGREVTHRGPQARSVTGGDGIQEQLRRGIVLRVGGLGEVAPQADHLDGAGCLVRGRGRGRGLPLLGSDAVAMKSGIDLQMHPSGAGHLRRAARDILEQSCVADADIESAVRWRSRISSSEPASHTKIRASSPSDFADGGSGLHVEGAEPSDAGCPCALDDRPRPCPYASSLTTSMCSAGATSPRMCARFAAKASRSTRSTGVTGGAPATARRPTAVASSRAVSPVASTHSVSDGSPAAGSPKKTTSAPRQDRRLADVDDAHVHRDASDDRMPLPGDRHGHPIAERADDALRVAADHEGHRRVSGARWV